jgi:hypothetical protein
MNPFIFFISPYLIKNVFIQYSLCSTAFDVSVTLGIGDHSITGTVHVNLISN